MESPLIYVLVRTAAVVSDCLTLVSSLPVSVLGWFPRGDRPFSFVFLSQKWAILPLGLKNGINANHRFTIPESLTGIGFAAILPRDWD